MIDWKAIRKYRSELTRQLRGEFYRQQDKKEKITDTYLADLIKRWNETTKRLREAEEKLTKGETMQYRLKRDLPFAKAGAEVRVHVGESIMVVVNGKSQRCIDSYFYAHMDTDVEIDRLISEGWIEEIKPKEFWVRKDHLISEEEIRKGFWDKDRFTKVHEIID